MMRPRWWIWVTIVIGLCCAVPGAGAQDAVNLPTELYVLTNSGQVQRYGLGAAGVVTVTPAEVFIIDFAVAPGNNWLAYRTEAGLLLADLFAPEADPLLIEGPTADVPPLRGTGSTMAWSPGGDALAYTTPYGARAYFPDSAAFSDVGAPPLMHLQWSPGGLYLAAESEGDIWWVYRRDGTALSLAAAIPSSRGLAWYDDARLIMAPASGGLVGLELTNANAQSFLQPETTFYREPFVRADGTIAAFVINPGDTPLEGDQAVLQRIAWDGSAFNVTATQTTPVDLANVSWAPGGDFLLAFRGGGIALLLPETGEGFALPIADIVAFDWGAPRPAPATGLTLSTPLFLLATDDLSGLAQVWRISGDGLPPIIITTSAASIDHFAVTQDGGAVIYVSAGGLYRQAVSGGDPLLLAQIGEGARDLDLSPDGARAVYAGAEGVYVVSTAEGVPVEGLVPVNPLASAGVEVTPEATGEAIPAPETALPEASSAAETTPEATGPLIDAPNTPTLLIANPDGVTLSEPAFSLDGSQLAVQGAELTVFDAATGQPIAALGQGTLMRWLGGGGMLFAADGGLYAATPSAQGSTPTLTLPATGLQLFDAIGLEPTRVYALTGPDRPGPTPLTLVAIDLTTPALTLPPATAEPGFISAPQISPDGLYIAGLTHPGGALIIYSLEQDRALTLSTPDDVRAFAWAGG